MPNQQLSQQTQRILDHLQEVWQRPQSISPADLRRITEFVLSLPEQYRQVGLAKVAESAINNMSLHILNLMAIFQKNAEQEISPENVKETLDQTLPESFQILSDLNSKVRVTSLDDVASLTNITTNFQILSWSNTAEEAQNWLYELPNMYYHQLTQEKLTVNSQPSVRWIFEVSTNSPFFGATLTDAPKWYEYSAKGSEIYAFNAASLHISTPEGKSMPDEKISSATAQKEKETASSGFALAA